MRIVVLGVYGQREGLDGRKVHLLQLINVFLGLGFLVEVGLVDQAVCNLTQCENGRLVIFQLDQRLGWTQAVADRPVEVEIGWSPWPEDALREALDILGYEYDVYRTRSPGSSSASGNGPSWPYGSPYRTPMR